MCSIDFWCVAAWSAAFMGLMVRSIINDGLMLEQLQYPGFAFVVFGIYLRSRDGHLYTGRPASIGSLISINVIGLVLFIKTM